MEKENIKLTEHFGASLAQLLSDKICQVKKDFPANKFIEIVQQSYLQKTLTQRVELIADALHVCLPNDYKKAVKILINIMGDENPKETGMFSDFYWLMPVGKFIEKYGLEHFETSMKAIEEHTKRNTGEYAIRPYIRKYPEETIRQMKIWAKSENFHLRRLASEGLRPKLPWASKLELFIDKPKPVFEILNILKTEHIKFVMKSVANNLADYIKVNPEAALALIKDWRNSKNKNTQWIIKHATRKLKQDACR
ncbi:MAG: DNA alkylation repair protein [Burkholderiales bacterium]|jgi:3-methyladenine DNA glycosylase AlkC|nr:DNA alkylation repair protein [Burkholderiales bacterium]